MKKLFLIIALFILQSSVCLAEENLTCDGILGFKFRDNYSQVMEMSRTNHFDNIGIYKEPSRVLHVVSKGTAADKKAKLYFELFDDQLFRITICFFVPSENVNSEFYSLKNDLSTKYGKPRCEEKYFAIWGVETTTGDRAFIFLSTSCNRLSFLYSNAALSEEAEKYIEAEKENKNGTIEPELIFISPEIK